ncbi:regulator of telomere elongation helicase 1 homolog [Onthophagus taurus]|uniref:regulator of telomere elongation helicase 1 homolog n=1 Tax=Onthophagus taurus TaxID=166361 RepID=UPI000C209AF5|nr:regulator of telomere elongation helicase 1 homolog isoform X2 [Onthophagus taurus]
MSTCNLRGVSVSFPFEPYSIQKDYMEKVLECLQNDVNGVLESPTGTGKTLSLLCSSLAWLTAKKAQMQGQLRAGCMEEADDFMKDLLDDLNKMGGAKRVNSFFAPPRIIYASRTHSQLSQAMQELRKTAYKHMKATVIGSREQLCINPEVMSEKANKNLMCQIKVKSRTCMFYNRIERMKNDPSIRENPITDIEDLVKIGNSHRCCPYYMAQELSKESDIIFMPYNYILDQRIRSSLDKLNLKDCVVILDEAHNIEKICEESASLQIKNTDITMAIEETSEVMKALSDTSGAFTDVDIPKDFEAEELCILKEMLLKLEKALDEIVVSNEGTTFEGPYIFEFLGKAGINQESFGACRSLCDKITNFLATASESPFKRRGDGLSLLSDLLAIVFIKPSPTFQAKTNECFKVHVTLEEKKKTRDNWLTKLSNKDTCRVLNYWCFSPGFGMNKMMDSGMKSVILTSGTLAPLKPLISELGISINVQLENPHVVSPNQICVRILNNGPDGVELNCNYKNRDNPLYLSSLGRTILNVIRLIPDGVLIFFPSYPILQKCQDHWQREGIWSDINAIKSILVEPKDKDAFNSAMIDYYAKIKQNKGAIFMGVCRGKVSEGLDFADINGRGVIIVGLPYPPLKDPKIVLKKRYLDVCNKADADYLKGDDWYSLEAVRAINQAIGRVIRHQHDYGAIILLDSRFNSFKIKSQLSLWLRDRIKVVNNFGMIVRDVKFFFNNAGNIKPPIKTEIKEESSQNSNISNLSVESQDPSTSGLVTIHKRSPPNLLENKPKKTRIVLVENKPQQQQPSNRDSEYMMTVRDALSLDEYKTFLKALSTYRDNSDFSQLVGQLDEIFYKKYSARYLLFGLACYIKSKDKKLYDEYCNTMN